MLRRRPRQVCSVPSTNRAVASSPLRKILCALYADPTNGYPPKYARDTVPVIEGYADGQTTPTPNGIDWTPGDLLGCVSGELGLRKVRCPAVKLILALSIKLSPHYLLDVPCCLFANRVAGFVLPVPLP